MPRTPKEKDQIDKLINQLDLSGITQEEMFGEGGCVNFSFFYTSFTLFNSSFCHF